MWRAAEGLAAGLFVGVDEGAGVRDFGIDELDGGGGGENCSHCWIVRCILSWASARRPPPCHGLPVPQQGCCFNFHFT